MSRANIEAVRLTSTLRQIRDPVIDVECRPCGRMGSYVRAELVKKHGAGITLARLRRMSALGCDRLVHPDGDQCGKSFPCLAKFK
ncbi:hypothetical protein [Pararhizobium qamdonense]|uniref:hypothetical protein n=1 Tax=Pararhizobium qamdonense TaxID=3031126 RepID=UPI0023E20080|nr:hypothetical protein [Pararhizobium qamdonense]